MTTLRIVSERSPLSALVCRPAVTIPATATVAEAAAAMEAASVSAVLVGDGPAIVTERDIARACIRGDPRERAVGEIATHRPVIAPATMTILDGSRLMLEQHVRHLVVDLGDRWTVLSIRDVTAVLLQSTNPELWLEALRVSIEVPSELFLG